MRVPFVHLDSITGNSLERPSIINTIPEQGEYDFPSNVYEFTLIDPDTTQGIDINTLNVTVNGNNAIVNGVFQSGFNGMGSTIVALDPNWRILVTIEDSNQIDHGEINIEVTVDTIDAITGTFSYSFYIQDHRKPEIEEIKTLNRRDILVRFKTDIVNPKARYIEVVFPWGTHYLDYDNLTGEWSTNISLPWVYSIFNEPFNLVTGDTLDLELDSTPITVTVVNNTTDAESTAIELTNILSGTGCYSVARNGKVYIIYNNPEGTLKVTGGTVETKINFGSDLHTRRLLFNTDEGYYKIYVNAIYPNGLYKHYFYNTELINERFNFILEEQDHSNKYCLNIDNYTLDYDKTTIYNNISPIYIGKFIKARVNDASSVILTLDQEFTPKVEYKLIVNNVQDYFGNIINPDYTVTFEGYFLENERKFNFYELFPEFNRQQDDTLDFKRFASVIQETAIQILSDLDEWINLIDITKASDNAIEGMLENMGNPFKFIALSKIKKRKLVSILVSLYKRKGTKQGIEDAIRFFFGINNVIVYYFWGNGWHLNNSISGILNSTTYLNSGSLKYRYSFGIYVDRYVTKEEKDLICRVANVMKTAHTHCVEVKTDSLLFAPDHWQLPYSHLGTETVLH